MRKVLKMILLGLVFMGWLSTGLWAEQKKPKPGPMPFHHRFGKQVRVYDPASVLVKFRKNFTEADRRKFQAQVKVSVADQQAAIAAFHAYYNTQPQGLPMFNWQRVQLPTTQGAAAAQVELRKNALVEAVELNYCAYAALESTTFTARAGLDDFYYADGYSQWWLNRTAGDDAVNGSYAFNGASVIVAVLDSGVQLDHPEFAGRLVSGYHAITPAAQPVDDDGHGTFVTGIVVANANNTSMIAGTAFKAEIKVMPVKVLDYTGSGYFSDIAAGIQWAVDHGANVLNMSFGAYATNSVLSDAIAYAANSHCFLVAAAGNDAENLTINPFYPAAYSEVMAVAATDAQNFITGYSNYGLGIIDLAAPGGDMTYSNPDYRDSGMVSTYLGSTVTALDGTSFASPQAAAVAALLLLQDPNRSVNDIWSIMVNHCENPQAELAKYIGAGRININAALSTAVQIVTLTPTCSPTPSPMPTSAPMVLGEKEVIVFPQPGKEHVRLVFTHHQPGLALAEIYNVVGEQVLRKEDTPGVVNGHGILDLATSNLGPGIYYLKLTITDAGGRRQLQTSIAIVH